MHTHKLNLKFNSFKECEKWEKEHFTESGKYYNGEVILAVMHDSVIDGDGVVLTEIITC